MPLSPLPFREVKRRLEAASFQEYSQRGSHVKVSDGTTLTAIVPHHQHVAVGTLRNILRQAEISVQDWNNL